MSAAGEKRKHVEAAHTHLISPDSPRGELVLSNPDGSHIALPGFSFGADRCVSGEVVFNTGMVGYPEALTDPSYRGQILVLTYPLIGNYGVPSEKDKDENGLSKWFESDAIHVAGLIVSDYSFEHSHWNAGKSLAHWLKEHNVPALFGLDTRMLAKKIREHGAMLGKVNIGGGGADGGKCTSPKKMLKPVAPSGAFDDPNLRNLVAEVSTKRVRVYGKGNRPRVLAFDCGMKYNIIRHFVNLGVELTVLPYDHDIKGIYDDYDGLFLSNGPGNPEMVKTTIENVRWALEHPSQKPIFGICLGNQVLGLAAGAKTYKLKYGNRGMNQPCIDMRTTRCYITPQNHGYAVDSNSLPAEWTTFFVNANDFTNEGIIHTTKPFFSVQFHPEASGGPMDTRHVVPVPHACLCFAPLFFYSRFCGSARRRRH